MLIGCTAERTQGRASRSKKKRIKNQRHRSLCEPRVYLACAQQCLQMLWEGTLLAGDQSPLCILQALWPAPVPMTRSVCSRSGRRCCHFFRGFVMILVTASVSDQILHGIAAIVSSFAIVLSCASTQSRVRDDVTNSSSQTQLRCLANCP